MISFRFGFLLLSVAVVHGTLTFPVLGQVEPATDGPKPLSPMESAQAFQVPEGFRIDLVASEPLIQAPSGVCWDAQGRIYVSELHGYNLEGQYDIEALNKTGQLDRVVRRIQADAAAKEKAEAGTYGRIKRLEDLDGDGRMDQMRMFARDLPPCYGMVPAREGLIAVCAPHIYYLADRDGDGVAEVREVLYTGFDAGILERRINAPQWGLDNWIYVGGGGRGGEITGPYLAEPVMLGRTDFRIRADGSAIESVAGQTATFGHTFSSAGDRVTISTGTPGYQVIPLPWRYLKRNPDLSVPALTRNAATYQTTYPLAKPHPWRTRRYEDPGFSRYYTERYGKAESTPSGYFTSACSPFIYRDIAFPEQYWGANFTCEPAQNLIHHSVPRWSGAEMNLIRGGAKPDREAVLAWARAERSKPLPELPKASEWRQLGPFEGTDKNSLFEQEFGPEQGSRLEGKVDGMSWVTKSHYHDGTLINLGIPENSAVYLARTLTAEMATTIPVSLGSNDAIQCWLNGTLILQNNVNRGVAADQEIGMLPLKAGENRFLMKIVNGTNASGFYFKLTQTVVPEAVRQIIGQPSKEWSARQYRRVAAYYQGMRAKEVQGEFLASTDSWFHPINLHHGPDGSIYIADYYREIIEDYSAIPRYLQQQYGLINGMYHGRVWRLRHETMPGLAPVNMALLTEGQLAREVGSSRAWRRETARRLLIERGSVWVRSAIAQHLNARRNPEGAINALYTLDGIECLSGADVDRALEHSDWTVRRHALLVGDAYPDGSEIKRVVGAWLRDPSHYGVEARMLLQIALSLGEFSDSVALDRLADLAVDQGAVRWMDVAIGSSSAGREAELLVRLWDREQLESRLAELLVQTLAMRGDAAQIQAAMDSLEEQPQDQHRDLFVRILKSGLEAANAAERIALPVPELPDETSLNAIEARWSEFEAALGQATDAERGKALFAEHCASCHQAGGSGQMAGPDLNSEFQRAPETILRDVLFPNEAITEGFETVHLEMRRGVDAVGLLASESPTSVTLRLPGGEERTYLRKQVARMRSYPVSLMPAQFAAVLEPDDVAAIIGFLREPRETE